MEFRRRLHRQSVRGVRSFREGARAAQDFIRTINSANQDTNAWARLESSVIDADGFDDEFRKEAGELAAAIGLAL